MKGKHSGGLLKSGISGCLLNPPVKALILTIILLAIMLPYWWLAVDWARSVLPSPDQHFTFMTTTFLLVLVIADSIFLAVYYQTVRKKELRKKTEELKQSEEALLDANKKLALLSGITRHDIKNQLAALGGYIELSRHAVDDPAELERIFEKEASITKMINRQIDFTADYEDMGMNAPVWSNLHQIIKTASSGMSLGNIRICEHDTDIEIYTDPLAVKLFFNLIDNTLRHGGEDVSEITISTKETASGLKIFYEDNGQGIPPCCRKNLFMRGYGSNTGLGLFLSKEILSITGIGIRETGDNEFGVCFEILVPAGRYRIPSGDS